jgi:hypothetical protein
VLEKLAHIACSKSITFVRRWKMEVCMWSPHRMCRRRSHTHSVKDNGENHLLSEKKAPASGCCWCRGEGRARASSGTRREYLNPLFPRGVMAAQVIEISLKPCWRL